MKTCRIYLIWLVGCIMICSNKEVIGQQGRFEGLTLRVLDNTHDSKKTPEQKELHLKLLRVIYTNIEIRGDSVAFLLDKAGFLAEGLPESAYKSYMLELKAKNKFLRNLAGHSPEGIKHNLSCTATEIAAYRKYFGYEYSSDIPLLEHIRIRSLGEIPRFFCLTPVYPVPDSVSFVPPPPNFFPVDSVSKVIIDKDVKVPSSTVTAIKNEMRRLIEAQETSDVPGNDNRTSDETENNETRQGETPEQGAALPP